jgi:hypothetical protein
MKSRIAAGIILTAVLTAGAISVSASDPIGVYAVVQKVVLEPSDTQPQRIQVWGAFSVADSSNPNDYQAPQVGYVYYSCPQGQESVCRNEWTDLKSVAATGTAVGFGGRRAGTSRVRKADEKPSSPDTYPIALGVIKMTERQAGYGPVLRLKSALAAK